MMQKCRKTPVKKNGFARTRRLTNTKRKKSDMSSKEQLEKQIARKIAEKSYEKYGDKLPVNIDPDKVVDAIFPAIEHEQRKHGRKITKTILKILGGCTLGVVGLIGLVAGAVLVIEKMD